MKITVFQVLDGSWVSQCPDGLEFEFATWREAYNFARAHFSGCNQIPYTFRVQAKL